MHAIARLLAGLLMGGGVASCVERDGLSLVGDAGFLVGDVAPEGSADATGENGSSCSPLPSPACGLTCCAGELPRCALSLSGGATCQPEGTLQVGVGCGANQAGRCASGLLCAGGWDREAQPRCRRACDPRIGGGCEDGETCADLSALFGAPAGACIAPRVGGSTALP